MKKRHIVLYDWPISQITYITESETAESFFNSLNEEDQNLFSTLMDSLIGAYKDLTSAKADKKHYDKWEGLRMCLQQYFDKFPSFPNQKFKQFILHTFLAEKLLGDSIDIEIEDLDETLFEVRELNEVLPLSYFAYENTAHFENSAAIICCNNIQLLETELINTNLSPNFAYSLLATITQTDKDISSGYWAIVKNTNPKVNLGEVSAFVRLLVLSTGKILHSAREYNKPRQLLSSELIKLNEGHQQWRDVHNILSEYNSRKDTLLKYLTIYHVIENLMLKLPIVELESKKSGKLFSIRDFKRLYKEVDGNEQVLLKRLITSVFNTNAKPGVTFGSHLNTRWKNLHPTINSSLIDKTLELLGIKLTYSFFNNNKQGIELFTSLVYQVRCAIVHNKETEFHLSHSNLDIALIGLIEDFLIPSLEEISFHMVGIKNNQVWYSSESILLYE